VFWNPNKECDTVTILQSQVPDMTADVAPSDYRTDHKLCDTYICCANSYHTKQSEAISVFIKHMLSRLDIFVPLFYPKNK
jgi:hypothetical protein